MRSVVTGASRGIGEAAARALARRGDRLALVQRSDPPAAAELGAHVVRADLSDAQAAVDALEEAADALGGIDVLVANAGTIVRSSVIDTSVSDFRRVVETDLVAQWAIAAAAARRFLDQGTGGAIVFTASVLSFQGGINVASYAASKAGLASLARSFANELASRGVRANCVAPGYVANDQTVPLRSDPERHAAITARIPQGRWAESAEIAEAILWLSSPEASYVNGTTLVVDGGWLGR